MRTLFGGDEVGQRPRAVTGAAPGAAYVRVAVERGIDRNADTPAKPGSPADRGDGTLTYWTDAPVQVGDRVDIPLGRGDTPTAGIVVEVGGEELLGGFDVRRVKQVTRVVGSRLPVSLIALARWMATYYVCPLGMVLATMMPAAVKHGTGKRTRTYLARPDPQPTSPPLPPLPPAARKAWDLIAALDAATFPIAPKDLAPLAGVTTLGPINKLIRAGLLQEVDHDEITAPAMPGFSAAAAPLPTLEGLMARPATPTLTPQQRCIVDGISATTGRFAAHLIRGVTGSGKTEVYLRVMETVLDRGHSALVLVPEISLTPQTAGRFEARFGIASGGAGVAVLHSGLTASQRHKQWARVAAGQCRVVVGARSAVFAPLTNLGLIVVDEEHDASYKQDQLPRYHGRDVAIKRAHLEGCPIILGSATPSMESWANASPPSPRYQLWTLEDRVAGGRLPKVELVSIAAERALALSGGQRPGLVGPTLAHALRRTLDDGGQAILLLNRRGFANYICCLDQKCGWSFRCDQCDVGMVHHRINPVRAGGFVRCHHCLSEQRLPKECPLCQNRVGVLGAGTQRVEEELVARFGLVEGDTFLRVDGDTMRSARDYFDVLSRFGAGEVKVLLGTQMIAKGLDYPNVRLVGVVDADTALNLPDFRAAERTFQLISQVAGRAGRGHHPGRVIVQTMNPDTPAVRLAALHDYVTFADEELQTRRRSHLPPASRMARIVVRDEDAAKAESHAREVADALRAAAATTPGADRLLIEGPAPCPMSRLANFYRFGIELTADDRGTLQSILAAVRAKGIVKSDARTAIDVDPLALL